MFGQVAIDVICSVAFQYDLHALETSGSFLVSEVVCVVVESCHL